MITAFLITVVLASGTNAKCDAGWEKHSLDETELCFRNFGKHDLQHGRGVCEKHNARLPLPMNYVEDNDLSNYLQKHSLPSCLLDATDTATEGRFVDSQGNPLRFTNWSKGQPDNYFWLDPLGWIYGGQDYVWKHMGEWNGQWDDRVINDDSNIVCTKYPVTTKPTSTTQTSTKQVSTTDQQTTTTASTTMETTVSYTTGADKKRFLKSRFHFKLNKGH